MASKLQAGDRVAYTARYLRDSCQQAGAVPLRRGTYAGPYAGAKGYSLVKWDDTAVRIAARSGQYADPEYAQWALANGEMCPDAIIAKVGSARYADPGFGPSEATDSV